MEIENHQAQGRCPNPDPLRVRPLQNGPASGDRLLKERKEKLKRVDKVALWKAGAVPNGRLLVGLGRVVAGKPEGPG